MFCPFCKQIMYYKGPYGEYNTYTYCICEQHLYFIRYQGEKGYYFFNNKKYTEQEIKQLAQLKLFL